MNRKSRSIGRRSSILKIDWNKEDDTGLIGNKSKRVSRRVSFAETYQVKEFPRDSPRCWKSASDSENEEHQPSTKPQGAPATITGLDKLLTGAIQTPLEDILTECPLPEVSVDSFNIFDSNRTMLDNVDMDTTYAAGTIELPQMDFQSEPSGEIKIDQVAFLKTLTNSSDSLKPTQIYSPNRDKQVSSFSSRMNSSFSCKERSPLKGLPVQTLSSFSYQDKENIVVDTEMLPDYQCTAEPDRSQPLYDIKKFFSNLLGTDAPSSSRQGVMKEVTAGQDATRIFSGEPESGAVEETKCIGGIIIQGDSNMVTNLDSDETVNLTIPMEETRALGGLVNKTLPENVPSDNQTVAMEETKVIGGILDKTTMRYVGLARSDETVTCPEAMEETKPLGGFMEKTFPANITEDVQSDDKTVAMEETRPIGGILDRTSVTLNSVKTRRSSESMNITNTVAMEETRPIGGILDNTSVALSNIKTTKSNESMTISQPAEGLANKIFTADTSAVLLSNKTVGMEETVAVGGILDDTYRAENTMEETKPVAGLLSNTVEDVMKDQSVHEKSTMEETKAVGGILDKTSESGHVNDAYSLYETVAMEETRPVADITNKSLRYVTDTTRLDENTVAMEETKAGGGILSTNTCTSKVTNLCKGLKLQPELNTDTGSVNTDDYTRNITMAMEETKALGEILKQEEDTRTIDCTKNVTMAMEETKALGEILKQEEKDTKTIDCTKNFTMAMEETRALGGIVKQEENDTGRIGQMEMLKSWGMEKTLHVNDAIKETKPVGGFIQDQREKQLVHNKSLDKSNIEEKTVIFDKFHADWTASQLLQNKSLSTAHNLTKSDDKTSHRNAQENSEVKVNSTPEEEPINRKEILKGDLISEDNLTAEKVTGDKMPSIESIIKASVDTSGKAMNRTVAETQVMEETKCVTGYLQVCDDSESKSMEYEDGEYIVDEDITFKKTLVDIEDMDITNCADLSKKNLPESSDNEKVEVSKVESEAIDSVSKVSNKRSFKEIRDSPDVEEEKTRDMTQSQMQLARLKEMLINSKMKTAAHLRSGDMKTPSKMLQLTSNSVSSSRSQTRELPGVSTGSPAYKKQRVQSEMPDVGNTISPKNTSITNLPTVDNNTIDGTHDITTGIDDEQMPDAMKNGMGTFLSGNETQSDHSRSTEPASSENKTSNTINMSVVSNKSFASSFNIPEGPLSLESFYTLTTRPASKISRGRCSTVFAPKIDMDDVEEVLNVQLTLKSLVEAKKNTEENQQEKINANVETAKWLEKTLEETQPQIFQECAQATADELQEIRDRLKILIRCCYSEASTIWKEETGKMVATALDSIQADGSQKADSILEDIRADIDSVDQLLMSVDTELDDLEKTEAQLTELQDRQETLTGNDEAGIGELEEKRKRAAELESSLLVTEQTADLEKRSEDFRQHVLAQLLCVDWNLDEMADDFVVFTFNQEHLELQVDYVPDTREKSIKNISLITRQSTERLGLQEEMALQMAVQAVETQSLIHKFPCFTYLPQILNEVSQTLREVNQFCREVRSVCFKHKLSISKNKIAVELWNAETLDLIKVAFSFDIHFPLSRSVSTTVKVTLGSLMPAMIESRLNSVKPGQNYLSRLIEVVDFQDLHR